MAMNGWGGARPGSGRKPGSKPRPKLVLNARIRAKLKKIERSENAKQFASDWLALAEPEILRRVVESDDLKVQVEVWKHLRAYAYGAPPQAVNLHVTTGPTPEDVLREIAEERRRRAAEDSGEMKALPPAPNEKQRVQ